MCNIKPGKDLNFEKNEKEWKSIILKFEPQKGGVVSMRKCENKQTVPQFNIPELNAGIDCR